MIRRARLRSLAKINLDLRVLHRRDDGYHELRTVFQTISLADSIEVEYSPAKRTTLAIDDRHNIPNNLILQAAAAVLETMKVHARVTLKLRKQIPMGAGLGGGSSNAAAILMTLPVLAGKPLAMEKLIKLGTALGSDVPFFLEGGTTLALGRGTEMYPFPEVAPQPVLLVAPGIHVSTVSAYQSLNLGNKEDSRKLTSPVLSPKINEFQRYTRSLFETRLVEVASALSANDFESPVFSLHPEIQRLFKLLRKVSPAVRMTGSGSALFAIFGSVAKREAAVLSLKAAKGFGKSQPAPPQLLTASLVSRAQYRRLWRRQLAPHAVPDNLIWPPRSRYSR